MPAVQTILLFRDGIVELAKVSKEWLLYRNDCTGWLDTHCVKYALGLRYFLLCWFFVCIKILQKNTYTYSLYHGICYMLYMYKYIVHSRFRQTYTSIYNTHCFHIHIYNLACLRYFVLAFPFNLDKCACLLIWCAIFFSIFLLLQLSAEHVQNQL